MAREQGSGYSMSPRSRWLRSGLACGILVSSRFEKRSQRARSGITVRCSSSSLLKATDAAAPAAIIFVYDFHACSTTLYEAHLSPLSALPPNPWSHPSHLQHTHAPFRSRHPTQLGVASTGGAGAGIAERVLWSYIVQIGSVIKAVHNAGLAVRNLEVNRILVTGANRVRIGGCGVLDVLGWDGSGCAGYQVRPSPSAAGESKLMRRRAAGRPTLIWQAHHRPRVRLDEQRAQPPQIGRPHLARLLRRPQERRSLLALQAWTSEDGRGGTDAHGWARAGGAQRGVLVSGPFRGRKDGADSDAGRRIRLRRS